MLETILTTKVCRYCKNLYNITQQDLDFLDSCAVSLNGKKFQIPIPTLCPSCRAIRRLSFRNERNLYKRKCDSTGKDIISIYSPDKSIEVYDQKIRRGDSWDPLDYGFEFDVSKTFTEQFAVLMYSIPHCSIYNINSENSDYTNLAAYNRNCYMIVESSNNEDCYHGYRLQKSNHCVDCSMVVFSECCYASIDLDHCYKLCYSQYCRECRQSWYLLDCDNCEFCFGCVGQEGKKYMLFNQQKTKEEYDSFLAGFLKSSREEKKVILEAFEQLKRNHGIIKHIRTSSDASGDYIHGSENIEQSTDINDAKNVRYSKHVWFNSGDCMDVDTVGYNSFLMYECINTALDAYKNLFCSRCWSGCSNLIYCFNCDSASNCFGCIGLRGKSYCIFNVQYSKEEYEAIVAKIITSMQDSGEWGEFFHPSLSCFGYNETVAMEQFPLEMQDAKLKMQNYNNDIDWKQYGYQWSDYTLPSTSSENTIDGKDLPELIEDVQDDIIKTPIKCETTGKLFRIIPQELLFYRKYQIPVPRKHPDQRHQERMGIR